MHARKPRRTGTQGHAHTNVLDMAWTTSVATSRFLLLMYTPSNPPLSSAAQRFSTARTRRCLPASRAKVSESDDVRTSMQVTLKTMIVITNYIQLLVVIYFVVVCCIHAPSARIPALGYPSTRVGHGATYRRAENGAPTVPHACAHSGSGHAITLSQPFQLFRTDSTATQELCRSHLAKR